MIANPLNKALLDRVGRYNGRGRQNQIEIRKERVCPPVNFRSFHHRIHDVLACEGEPLFYIPDNFRVEGGTVRLEFSAKRSRKGKRAMDLENILQT